MAFSYSFSSDGIPSCLQLWEFLLHHLELGKLTDVLCWTDSERGLLRILKPNDMAAVWGSYRQTEKRTYENMSRALRYYYNKNILEQTNIRLVYKFTPRVMRYVAEYRINRQSGETSPDRALASETDSESSEGSDQSTP